MAAQYPWTLVNKALPAGRQTTAVARSFAPLGSVWKQWHHVYVSVCKSRCKIYDLAIRARTDPLIDLEIDIAARSL